ncbi:hypothetical protein IFM89_020767 [Coptis chinensis]|uniref:Pentatricopeptide repeat-containing protein n=1 Tax=Coptis chinensis TaxID=261450 RepID=A0A835MAB8_9MAGN|nr:hypothetical protein IFM89_020767 [Coptis chinensis]
MYCKCDNIEYAELVNASTGTENVFSMSSLIVGHSSRGDMVEARRLFDSLKEKNSVVWTALFSGYVRLRNCDAVFELFLDFNTNKIQVPDALILINVLGGCAILAALHPGKQIHTYMVRMEIKLDERLRSSLADMYAKCGEIEYAERIFKRAPCRDRVMYNSMIAGYAHHGYENKAIRLFEEMLERSITPDAITFIALLSACRHAGLVELGDKYFASMKQDYGILPEIDHYSCMVDLYGRTNCLDKAVELMKEIPVKRDAVIWGTFLNACMRNESMELAREAEETLLRIEADNGDRYVQLANVYAAEGNWREMCRIRGKMRGGEVRKLAGCSWSQWFSSMKKEYLKFSAPWSGWHGKFYHTVAMLQFYEKVIPKQGWQSDLSFYRISLIWPTRINGDFIEDGMEDALLNDFSQHLRDRMMAVPNPE